MYKIITKKPLNDSVVQMEIDAPLVANKAKAGQFIILRVDEDGERIPLTVAGTDKEKGTVKIIFQIVGGTTMKLAALKCGRVYSGFRRTFGKGDRDRRDKKGVYSRRGRGLRHRVARRAGISPFGRESRRHYRFSQ